MPITKENIADLVEQLRGHPGASNPISKAGAKMSKANKEMLGKVRKSAGVASDYFGKAADAHPDDENISNGMAHHAAMMSTLDKLDAGLSDAELQGSTTGKQPSDAEKTVEATDIIKAALAPLQTQLGEMQKSLEALGTDNKKLIDENAALRGQVEKLGKQPIIPKARLGGNLRPVERGSSAEAIAAAARGGDGNETIKMEDIKRDDPDAFTKALSVVRANPRSVREPEFEGGRSQIFGA